MEPSFLQTIFRAHQDCPAFPTQQDVHHFVDKLIGTLFPAMSTQTFDSYDALEFHLLNLREELYEMLFMPPNRGDILSDNKAEEFFQSLDDIYDLLNKDADAIYRGDPAATSRLEVIRTYPGFYAIACHRIAHRMHELGVQIIPRMIAEYAKSKTGVEIHPAAQIGESFCIDHGTGVVIGATSVIGNHVKVYQGVTLGALSVRKEDAEVKRHPTIEDNVVIYAGATILGGRTTVGAGSIIGGNVWVTKSLEPGSKMYYHASHAH